MLGLLAKVDPFHIGSCFGWRKGFVERPLCVRVQVVTNQDHVLGVWVVFVQQRVPRQVARGGFLDGRVDLLGGRLGAQLDGQVGDRPGRYGNAEGVAVQLAVQLGDDLVEQLLRLEFVAEVARLPA